jgi:LysR family transcriptional regulator, glycine cleavage system transcriptional activator
MSSLRAFEATARHLSFTRAATELNLTQGAVSHRIKVLEDLLGASLFRRNGSAIALTEVGREYLPAARAAIVEVMVATDSAIERHRGDVLTVGCLPTFAIKCLIPALRDFRARHPKFSLRVRLVMSSINVSPQDYDVSIQFGVGDWPGMIVSKLADEEVFPVCSPELLKGARPLRSPKDLRHHTVIRTATPVILRDDWSQWLTAAGIRDMQFASELICDFLFPSFQAAIEGLGVTMGRSMAVRADLTAGRLVEPFELRLPSPLAYYLAVPAERAKLPKVELFRSWLLGQFGVPGQ